MNAEFNWWLLIVGVAVGAAIAWLTLADFRREEEDVGEVERRTEAAWIAETMRNAGWRADEAGAEEILRLHQVYLASLPPDMDEASAEPVEEQPADRVPSTDRANAPTPRRRPT